MTEAPERIWALPFDEPQSANSLGTWGVVNGLEKTPRIEYVRKDVTDLARRVIVAEAAKVLLDVFEAPMHNAPNDFDWQSMYDEMSADHKESMEICGDHDWPSILTVALTALSQKP